LLANPVRHSALQRLSTCIRQQAGSYEWIAMHHLKATTAVVNAKPGAGLLANPIRHSPLQRLNACIRQQAGSYEWIAMHHLKATAAVVNAKPTASVSLPSNPIL
jgi:ribosomal protein L20